MVNAPAIKQRIQARSAARQDAPDVAAWLGNHFYRHVVGNVQADPPVLQRIADVQALEQLLGSQQPPDWVLARLRQQAAGAPLPPLWWLEPDAPAVLALEARLVEFLTTRQGTPLEGKLQRINAPQALARWTLEHLAFAQKQHSGWVEHSPSAVQGVLPGQHGVFFELARDSRLLRQEMAYESQMMGHCVGQFSDRKHLQGGYGERYADSVERGRMRLFSYRTGKAQPRITINAMVSEDGLLEVEQIKGKQNRPPIARYVPDVVALLNHLPLTDDLPADALAMGIVRRPHALLQAQPGLAPWCAVQSLHSDAEQLWLMHTHPELLVHAPLQSPLVQWLVAARKDTLEAEVLQRMPQSPALQRSLQLAQQRPARTGGHA